MNYVFKHQLIRLAFFLIPSAGTRSRLLKKYHFFYEMGENVHFQPRHLPADPKFIKIHNNVSVASNVTFITHDIIHNVFNHIPDQSMKFHPHLGCIEIMDNVFVGAGTIIMSNVRIGPNVIVAAGSVVTKDVQGGVIVGGCPAKEIGSFDVFFDKRKEENQTIEFSNRLDRVGSEWMKFNQSREKSRQ